jgi:hypothetical protein
MGGRTVNEAAPKPVEKLESGSLPLFQPWPIDERSVTRCYYGLGKAGFEESRRKWEAERPERERLKAEEAAHAWACPTFSARTLIEKLQALDPDTPIRFYDHEYDEDYDEFFLIHREDGSVAVHPFSPMGEDGEL